MRTRMMRGPRLFRYAAGAAAGLSLAAVAGATFLTQIQGGLWEISGGPGKKPVLQCVAEVTALARFEHRGRNCAGKIVKSSDNSTVIDYNCGFAGFGHSEVDMLTPRSLRIDTQGISDGMPFAYVLQARRLGDCPASQSPPHH
jgi:hypothetical protein